MLRPDQFSSWFTSSLLPSLADSQAMSQLLLSSPAFRNELQVSQRSIPKFIVLLKLPQPFLSHDISRNLGGILVCPRPLGDFQFLPLKPASLHHSLGSLPFVAGQTAGFSRTTANTA